MKAKVGMIVTCRNHGGIGRIIAKGTDVRSWTVIWKSAIKGREGHEIGCECNVSKDVAIPLATEEAILEALAW